MLTQVSTPKLMVLKVFAEAKASRKPSLNLIYHDSDPEIVTPDGTFDSSNKNSWAPLASKGVPERLWKVFGEDLPGAQNGPESFGLPSPESGYLLHFRFAIVHQLTHGRFLA